MISTSDFAQKMAVNYRTALNWLRAGLVPGAVERKLPKMSYWEIPVTALQMERPKPGPKKGTKRNRAKAVKNGKKARKKKLPEQEGPAEDQ